MGRPTGTATQTNCLPPTVVCVTMLVTCLTGNLTQTTVGGGASLQQRGERRTHERVGQVLNQPLIVLARG